MSCNCNTNCGCNGCNSCNSCNSWGCCNSCGCNGCGVGGVNVEMETVCTYSRYVDVPMSIYYGGGYTELNCCEDTRTVLEKISDSLAQMSTCFNCGDADEDNNGGSGNTGCGCCRRWRWR